MIDQEIERKIEDFRALGIPDYIPRKGRVELVDNMVSTVIGARRAGKSFRVLQVADEMLRQGAISSMNHICLLVQNIFQVMAWFMAIPVIFRFLI